MKLIRATVDDVDKVYEIVSASIWGSYTECYSKEIVKFFLNIHSKENIKKDIRDNEQWILSDAGLLVGTGCRSKNHITRVYILPLYQRRGYGTYIMDRLEKDVAKSYETAYIDPSLSATEFYSNRGYMLIKRNKFDIGDGNILVHDVMEKKLR